MRAHLTAWRTKTSSVSRVVLTIAIALLSTSTAIAQSQTFKHRAADGTITFSDAPIRNGVVVRTSYHGVTRKAVFANPCKGLTVADLNARAQQLSGLFERAAAHNNLKVSLLKAVARAESCFDPLAVSRAGAKGLMQLMPATAAELGVSDIFDSEQNLAGGARYLAAMLRRYSNDLDLALAAYNAGPGNVDRYNGIPPFKETQRYIVSVKRFTAQFANISGTSSGASTHLASTMQ